MRPVPFAIPPTGPGMGVGHSTRPRGRAYRRRTGVRLERLGGGARDSTQPRSAWSGRGCGCAQPCSAWRPLHASARPSIQKADRRPPRATGGRGLRSHAAALRVERGRGACCSRQPCSAQSAGTRLECASLFRTRSPAPSYRLSRGRDLCSKLSPLRTIGNSPRRHKGHKEDHGDPLTQGAGNSVDGQLVQRDLTSLCVLRALVVSSPPSS
jgi:hypothetical protein